MGLIQIIVWWTWYAFATYANFQLFLTFCIWMMLCCVLLYSAGHIFLPSRPARVVWLEFIKFSFPPNFSDKTFSAESLVNNSGKFTEGMLERQNKVNVSQHLLTQFQYWYRIGNAGSYQGNGMWIKEKHWKTKYIAIHLPVLINWEYIKRTFEDYWNRLV